MLPKMRLSAPSGHVTDARRTAPVSSASLFLCCLLSLPGCTQFQDNVNPSGAPKWTPLFEGKSLNGWHTHGEPGVWRVEDGQIVGELVKPSPYAYLVTDETFGNFELKLEMLYDSPGGNSGVFFWSSFPPQCAECNEVIRAASEAETDVACPKCGSRRIVPYAGRVHIHGPQAEFAPPGSNTGGLYDSRFGTWINPDQFTPEMQAAHRFGEWNSFLITASGRNATVVLNGQTVSDVKGYDFPAQGHIALQLHSGDAMKIRFRNICVRALPDTVK